MQVKPGICGICGVAVVQPESPAVGWKNGHVFERDADGNLVLKRVRCMAHKEPDDPRYYDRTGEVREDRWSCEVVC